MSVPSWSCRAYLGDHRGRYPFRRGWPAGVHGSCRRLEGMECGPESAGEVQSCTSRCWRARRGSPRLTGRHSLRPLRSTSARRRRGSVPVTGSWPLPGGQQFQAMVCSADARAVPPITISPGVALRASGTLDQGAQLPLPSPRMGLGRGAGLEWASQTLDDGGHWTRLRSVVCRGQRGRTGRRGAGHGCGTGAPSVGRFS